MRVLPPSISIIVKGRKSPYEVIIYGLNFENEAHFNKYAIKIYTEFLNSNNIIEIQKIMATTTSLKQGIAFQKAIFCSGNLDVNFFRELAKLLPGIQFSLSMPKKRAKKQVTFDKDLFELFPDELIPLNDNDQELTKHFKILPTKALKRKIKAHILIMHKNDESFIFRINSYFFKHGIETLIPRMRKKRIALEKNTPRTATRYFAPNKSIASLIKKRNNKKARESYYYSPNATLDDWKNALKYAITPLKATINCTLNDQTINKTLRQGLVFDDKIISAPKIPDAYLEVNRAKYQETSLIIPRKSRYQNEELQIFVDSLLDLALNNPKANELHIQLTGTYYDTEAILIKIKMAMELLQHQHPQTNLKLNIDATYSNEKINKLLAQINHNMDFIHRNSTASTSLGTHNGYKQQKNSDKF